MMNFIVNKLLFSLLDVYYGVDVGVNNTRVEDVLYVGDVVIVMCSDLITMMVM